VRSPSKLSLVKAKSSSVRLDPNASSSPVKKNASTKNLAISNSSKQKSGHTSIKMSENSDSKEIISVMKTESVDNNEAQKTPKAGGSVLPKGAHTPAKKGIESPGNMSVIESVS
jgi:hypothetical protein